MAYQKQAVLTGCDQNQEWMLKWWWKNFSKCNNCPVIFCDFGMSKSARLWCETKGIVKSLPSSHPNFLNEDEKIPISLKKKWEKIYFNVDANIRNAWMKKPLFLPLSPYEQNLWIDLDCEIKKPLFLFFDILDQSGLSFAVAKDTPRGYLLRLELGFLKLNESAYQSGVFAFTKDSPVIKAWVENCLQRSHLFFSDQDALNRTIYENHFNIFELSPYFNLIPGYAQLFPCDPLIIHHVTLAGKKKLFRSMVFSNKERIEI